MAITTLAKVNNLLGYTTGDDTTRDNLISTLIPIIQDKVIKYTRNDFLNKNVQIDGAFAFVNGSPDTITDSQEGFVDADIVAGDYRIRFSKHNSGIVTVSSVAAGTLTLSTTTTVVNESADNSILITQVKWPAGIDVDVANLINYYLSPKKGQGIKSESLPGGYSVTFASEVDLMKPFEVYK